MKRLLILFALSACADPGYDVARVRVPDDLPRARVLIPDGGRPLIVLDDRLYGRCYALAIEHEKRHIADPNWKHDDKPFVCTQRLDNATMEFLLAGSELPTMTPTRSKGGYSKWFPGICDPPVTGGPQTAYCRSRKPPPIPSP